MTTLTIKLLDYKNDLCSFDEVLSLTRQFVYDFPKKISKRYHEYSGSFLIFMDTRIPSLINRFEYRNLPFEAYLNTTLRLQFLTFLKQVNKTYAQQAMISQREYATAINVAEVHEHDPTRLITNESTIQLVNYLISGKNKKSKSSTHKHRLWWFLLKYRPEYPDLDYLYIGKMLNLTKFDVIHDLRTTEKETLRLSKKKALYQERANVCFHKAKTFEFTIKYKILCEQERIQAIHLMKVYKSRYTRLVKKARESYHISNKTLSTLIGVPKGTLDSGIFYLKKDFASLKRRAYLPYHSFLQNGRQAYYRIQ